MEANGHSAVKRRTAKDRLRVVSRRSLRGARTARGPRSTLDSIATPCSAKAYGVVRRPPPPAFEITICDLKDSGLPAAMREPI